MSLAPPMFSLSLRPGSVNAGGFDHHGDRRPEVFRQVRTGRYHGDQVGASGGAATPPPKSLAARRPLPVLLSAILPLGMGRFKRVPEHLPTFANRGQ